MIKTIARVEMRLKEMVPHGRNREFPTEGEEWDEFVGDVKARGIQEDLVVRRLEDGPHQVLRGHRRRLAGIQGGIKKAWCVVVECGDEEAFEHMWGGNLFRENVNAADEAEAVRVMMVDFGRTREELAAKWARSAEWIGTRQALLELGDEVMAAVRCHGRERLTMGAVEEILRVPLDLRERAVQMVLHPVHALEPLGAEQARSVLRHVLLEPLAASAAWEEQRKAVAKAWRKDLEGLCLPMTSGDLMVQTKGVAEAATLRGMIEAKEKVALERLHVDAPPGLRWLHLAVKHDVPVLVLPGDSPGESRAVVNGRLLVDAEAALEEHGGACWLLGKKRVKREEGESGDGSRRGGEDEDDDSRVAKARADVEAGYDTAVDVADGPETEITQSMSHHAMLNMGVVKQVALWAVSTDSDPMNAPEWVPKWAREMAIDGHWTRIDEVVDWVVKLKV